MSSGWVGQGWDFIAEVPQSAKQGRDEGDTLVGWWVGIDTPSEARGVLVRRSVSVGGLKRACPVLIKKGEVNIIWLCLSQGIILLLPKPGRIVLDRHPGEENNPAGTSEGVLSRARSHNAAL